MNVSLTPQLEHFTRTLVETGRYNSASEVVRNALRLLEEREAETLHLRRQLQEGFDANATPYDADDIRSMLVDYAERLDAARQAGE